MKIVSDAKIKDVVHFMMIVDLFWICGFILIYFLKSFQVLLIKLFWQKFLFCVGKYKTNMVVILSPRQPPSRKKKKKNVASPRSYLNIFPSLRFVLPVILVGKNMNHWLSLFPT